MQRKSDGNAERKPLNLPDAPGHAIHRRLDEDHVIVTQPLVELLPLIAGDPAILRIEFGSVGMLGIEAAIGFVSAYASDGTMVLDRIVSFEGESIEMPAGEHIVRAYYRTCDGHCGLLDPAQDFCSIEHTFVAGEEFDVTVTDDGRGGLFYVGPKATATLPSRTPITPRAALCDG